MSTPSVSVVIVTHQFEHFIERAVDSALSQEYPADALEVIVVDDGSRDGTPERVRAYGDRVRYLRHPNVGSARSVERGLLAATGDVIVLLDGDDALHPGLVARQVTHLREHPEVGLVTVDRRVLDGTGSVLVPSFARATQLDRRRGRPLGHLMSRNFVTLSGVALRATLVPAVLPIAEEAPAEDWWLAVNVTRWAEIDFIDEALVDYRHHGANRNLGNTGSKILPLVRRDLRWRRWMLRNLWCSPLATPAELLEAHAELRRWGDVLERDQPGATREAMAVDAGHERMRDAYLARSGAEDDAGAAVRLLVAALGHDPFHAEALARVDAAAAWLAGGPRPAWAEHARVAAGPELHIVGIGDGLELAVPQERRWAFNGGRYYELSVTHWLERLLGAVENPVFYDVGSNIGYYPVRFAAAARHVYAFEPVSSTLAILEENARRNGLGNVSAVAVGLTDQRGTAEINLWSSSGSNTLFHREFGADHPHRLIGTETIALDRLDDLVAERGLEPPDVMKIDIEGAELPALRGALQTLRAHRPHLIVECEADACADAGYRPQDLHDELRALGYVLFGLDRNPADARLHPLEGREAGNANLVALPPGSPLLREVVAEAIGEQVGSAVTVAWLDDVLAEPELLRAYASAVGAGDDATLIIWAPGQETLLHDSLVRLVTELGLDGPDAPDMLGVSASEAQVGHLLAGAARGVLGTPRPGFPAATAVGVSPV